MIWLYDEEKEEFTIHSLQSFKGHQKKPGKAVIAVKAGKKARPAELRLRNCLQIM